MNLLNISTTKQIQITYATPNFMITVVVTTTNIIVVISVALLLNYSH